MPAITFRRQARQELQRLLSYWRDIELSIKKVEQIEKRAVIPAINELRYGARQLHTGVFLFGKARLTAHEQTTIRRRLWVAEQYFMNADHDVVDALVKYVSDIADGLDWDLGEAAVATFYPGYPAYKQTITACFDLIADARFDYNLRMTNYNIIKNQHVPVLIDNLKDIKAAEIRARHANALLERELVKAKRTVGIQAWFTYVTGAATLLSVPLSIYLWAYASTDFCRDHGTQPFLRMICPTPTTIDPPKGLQTTTPAQP